MGKVFNPNIIGDGNVCLEPQHLEAGEFVLDTLSLEMQQAGDESLFDAAMIYGSTVDGPGPTLRSDLDVLVIYSSDQEQDARVQVGKIAEATEEKFKVSVEPQLYPPGADIEQVDPLYAEHIVEVGTTQKQWCLNDPAKAFEKHLLSPDDQKGYLFHALGYLYGKAGGFEAALDGYGGFADYSVMQRALELPSAIGRKILPATKQPGEELPHISNKAGMRARVQDRIQAHFSGEQAAYVADDQTKLAFMDKTYTKILTDTLREIEESLDGQNTNGGSPLDVYDEWIEDHYLEACRRAENLSRSWAVVLEKTFEQMAPEQIRKLDGLDNSIYYSVADYS